MTNSVTGAVRLRRVTGELLVRQVRVVLNGASWFHDVDPAGAFKIKADGPRIVAVNSQGETMPPSPHPHPESVPHPLRGEDVAEADEIREHVDHRPDGGLRSHQMP